MVIAGQVIIGPAFATTVRLQLCPNHVQAAYSVGSLLRRRI